jgi:CheY-like chemotaxis protein
VSEPTRRGFGLTPIENTLAYELGGRVQLDFPAEGLSCTVLVPWDQIASLAEPAPVARKPEPAATDSAEAALRGKRMLVAEDNALLAANIVRNLRVVGVSVVGPVARMEAAIELAETAEINIAILDIDLDGKMVCPAADRLADRSIPFVFTSGYRASLIMPRCFEASPVLKKPFTVRELLGTLSQSL